MSATLVLALTVLAFNIVYGLVDARRGYWSKRLRDAQDQEIENQHQKIMELLNENIALKWEIIRLKVADLEDK